MFIVPHGSPVLLDVAFEVVQAHLPKRSIALQPSCDGLESMRAQLVHSLPPDALLHDKARKSKNAKMLGHRWTALLEVAGQGVHRRGPCPKTVEDRPTGRIRDGMKDISVRSRPRHDAS
jgi:hypothetical protein